MADPATRLISGSSPLPSDVDQRLRKLAVDKFRGNVQLNYLDGCVVGLRIEEVVTVTVKR